MSFGSISLCIENGRVLNLAAPSWNKISPTLCFSSKIFLEVIYCSNMCHFFLERHILDLLDLLQKEETPLMARERCCP